jgi:hypothetical protein
VQHSAGMKDNNIDAKEVTQGTNDEKSQQLEG